MRDLPGEEAQPNAAIKRCRSQPVVGADLPEADMVAAIGAGALVTLERESLHSILHEQGAHRRIRVGATCDDAQPDASARSQRNRIGQDQPACR